MTIAGVVADSRYATLRGVAFPGGLLAAYAEPLEWHDTGGAHEGRPDALLPALRSAIRDVDARVSSRVRPMPAFFLSRCFPGVRPRCC